MTFGRPHYGDDVHPVELAMQEDGGWQPIETAPKDGTRFWGNEDDDAIAMLWHKDFNAFVSTWRQMTFAENYGGGVRNHSPHEHFPTHWMPRVSLPAAPTEGE
jgi:hypothetical protein